MVGARIKEYLNQNGIKQSYLAEKVGLSNSQISDICNHDRKIDCLEYYKICQALNVPFETFIPDEGET
jgi:transcriptional regulator with XRE-family HTH domain